MTRAVIAAALVGLLSSVAWWAVSAGQGAPAAQQPLLVKRNSPYADPAHERQVLDVYAPKDAKNLPVVFWIHGGGWQGGDKSEV